ncbi:hypothetical protein AB4144_05495, partial [Rhizobiaceae sp. 2RAB30]
MLLRTAASNVSGGIRRARSHISLTRRELRYCARLKVRKPGALPAKSAQRLLCPELRKNKELEHFR